MNWFVPFIERTVPYIEYKLIDEELVIDIEITGTPALANEFIHSLVFINPGEHELPDIV